MKPLVISALGLAVVTMTCSTSFAQDTSPPARPAKVFTVQATDIDLQRVYSAIVYPSQEVELSFRVSGQITDLPIRGATQLSEGDVVARLDPRDFETAIAQLESQRDQSMAQLAALRTGARDEEVIALEASVAAAQAKVNLALDQVERTRTLAERGVAAQALLDQDEANLDVAEADLQARVEELAIAKSGARSEDIEAAQAALRGLETQIQTARDNLSDATLRAPFSGIVAIRHVENFSNIQAGQDIALLQSLSTVDLAFDVPGVDVSQLANREDLQASVVFRAMPDRIFEAELVEFSVQADASTQTYRGRVAVDLPQGVAILPGMVGNVVITVQRDRQTALQLPLTAVVAQANGAPFVWIVDPISNSVSPRQVELGAAMGDLISVTTGVAPGDTVVTAGIGQLQDGMVIRPITKIGD